MDPGLGLVVGSMVPNEVDVPKPTPKPPLKLPPGFLDKAHVRHALKYIPDDEQRGRALEVAMAWKKKFAAEKWKSVVTAIVTASQEDHIRLEQDDVQLHELHETPYPTKRPRAMTTTSAPTGSQTITQSMPIRTRPTRLHTATASLPLRRTPAPSTPRTYRWDLMPTGPVTPLSPMPLGNSFSGGGYWGISTPNAEKSDTATPFTALNHALVSPIVPMDAEARAIYDRIKGEMDNLARKYCLARHDMRSSGSDNEFVPSTMIRPRDVAEAAQVTLRQRKMKLKTAIAKDLPQRLRKHAIEEAALRSRLCIKYGAEIAQQNRWMNDEIFATIPESLDSPDYKVPIHMAVSILDEQREALRMFREQRKDGDLELTDQALECAWAVRILEDAERLMEWEADGSSNGDTDDDGYSYGNFLRSIKSEMSTSTSSGALTSMVEELSNSDLTSLRSRANTQQTDSSTRSRDFHIQQRLSTSPIKENRLLTRSNDASISTSHKQSTSIRQRTDLRISTADVNEGQREDLSPEDREFRHRGPNLTDLNDWAAELKKMEAMRAARQRSPTLHRRPPNRDNGVSSTTHQQSPAKQMSVDSSNTHISPSRQLHSRFSSSSSSVSTDMMRPLARPSFESHALPSLVASESSIIDRQYHQRNISKQSTGLHQRDPSKNSMHDSLDRNQHSQSTRNVKVLEKESSKADEDDWMMELKRMESRERSRQGQDRRRTSQLSESGDGEIGDEMKIEGV